VHLLALLTAKLRSGENPEQRTSCISPQSCGMVQAASRRSFTVEVRVRSQASRYGFCGGQSVCDRFLSQYFGFPPSVPFH